MTPDMQGLTPEQQRAIALAKARKRKAAAESAPPQEQPNAIRPAPKQSATLNPSQQAQLEMFGALDKTMEGNLGRLGAYSAQTGNSAVGGALDYLSGGLDSVAARVTGMGSPDYGDSVSRVRQARQDLREMHPLSATAGDVTGAIALGLPAFKATAGIGDDIIRAIPGKNALAQGARFVTRGAGSALEGLKQLALYEAGAGASNRAAEEGRDVGIQERAGMAKDAVTDPVMGSIAAATGPLGIGGSRLFRYGAKGRFTPPDVPGGVGGAPALEDIEQMKQQAYKIADDLGVNYTPDSFADLVARIETRLGQEGIDPVLHQRATRNLRRIQDRVGDQPISLQELDRIRQFTRRDVIDSSRMGSAPGANAGEARLGSIVMDEIDEFIESGQGAVSGGEEAGQAITQARRLNAVWRRAQLLADAAENAQLRSASTGSGGNFENALRQEIRKIYTNPKKVRGFSEAERRAMREVIEGGPVQNLLRQIGKLSPQGNGLMAAIGVGSTAANPFLAPIWLGGMAAKHMAEKGIKGKFDILDDMVRGGANRNALSQGAKPPPGSLSPEGLPQTGQRSANALTPRDVGAGMTQNANEPPNAFLGRQARDGDSFEVLDQYFGNRFEQTLQKAEAGDRLAQDYLLQGMRQLARKRDGLTNRPEIDSIIQRFNNAADDAERMALVREMRQAVSGRQGMEGIKPMGFFGFGSKKPQSAADLVQKAYEQERRAYLADTMGGENTKPTRAQEAAFVEQAIEKLKKQGVEGVEEAARPLLRQKQGPEGFEAWLSQKAPQKPPEMIALENQRAALQLQKDRLGPFSDDAANEIDYQIRQINQRLMGWQEEYANSRAQWMNANRNEIERALEEFYGRRLLDDSKSDIAMSSALGLGLLSGGVSARNALEEEKPPR